MSYETNRRMRLQLTEEQVEKIAQLKAHYAHKAGAFVPAHLVLRWALAELHTKVFEREDHELPADWRYYEK